MKKTILALSVLLSFFSCDNENTGSELSSTEIIANNESNFEIDYQSNNLGKFTFEASISKNVVFSSFLISGLETEFRTIGTINRNIEAYKLSTHQMVVDEATKLLEGFSNKLILEDISNQFEIFAKQILTTESINHSSDLVQSLFIHNAILKTAIRSIENKSICNCTPHPGYYVDKTSFWCQEDYSIDTERFYQAIKQSNYKLNDAEQKLFDYLNKTRGTERYVTSDKLFSIIEDKTEFINRVEQQFLRANNKLSIASAKVAKEDCFKGSDLGCCGNYSGCCWYSSIYCLYHDAACWTCEKWHCGPACTPGAS